MKVVPYSTVTHFIESQESCLKLLLALAKIDNSIGNIIQIEADLKILKMWAESIERQAFEYPFHIDETSKREAV